MTAESILIMLLNLKRKLPPSKMNKEEKCLKSKAIASRYFIAKEKN